MYPNRFKHYLIVLLISLHSTFPLSAQGKSLQDSPVSSQQTPDQDGAIPNRPQPASLGYAIPFWQIFA